MKRYAKLIMVTEGNNNKYYEMSHTGGDTFSVKYGRVDSTSTVVSYPIKKWDSLYNSKVRKGYRDVTDLVTVSEDFTEKEKIDDGLPGQFLKRMLEYSRNLVRSSYTVASATQEQINRAQLLINQLSTVKDTKKINELLIELYTVIPRRMSKVQDHLYPKIELSTFIQDEQDKLDAIAMMIPSPRVEKESKLLSESLGISIQESKDSKSIDYILKQANRLNYKVLDVNIPREEGLFVDYKKSYKDQTTRFLIHGTRPSNVMSIISTGLQIRPSNCATFSGKAYGEGNYFSEHIQKSLNYTGYDSDKVLLIYEVFTGNPFVYDGWYRGNSFPLTYNELKKRGYNSTYVKPGNGLMNSEIIVYNQKQQKLSKILWIS